MKIRSILGCLLILLPLGSGCSDEIGAEFNADEPDATSESDAGVAAVDTGRYTIVPSESDEDGERTAGEPGYIDVEDFATSCSSSSQCEVVRTDICVPITNCSTSQEIVNDKFGNEIRELRDKVYSEECPEVRDNQSTLDNLCVHFPMCLEGNCTSHLPFTEVNDRSLPPRYPDDPKFVTPETAVSVEDFDRTCTTGADCKVVRKQTCMACPSAIEAAPLDQWAALANDDAARYEAEFQTEVCEEYQLLPDEECAFGRELQAVCMEGSCQVRENDM